MLFALKKLVSFCQYTPFHPQWMANKAHLKNVKRVCKLQNKKVLEIGCGNSILSQKMQSSNRLIRGDYPATSERYSNLPHVYFDARQLPIADSSIDVVVVYEVLEHVKDYRLALQEIKRVLCSNGELYLSVPFLYPVHDEPFDYQRFTEFGLKSDMSEMNLELVEYQKYPSAYESIAQLINIIILRAILRSESYSKVLAFFLIVVLYPVLICINIVSCVVATILPNEPVFYLGQFLRARK